LGFLPRVGGVPQSKEKTKKKCVFPPGSPPRPPVMGRKGGQKKFFENAPRPGRFSPPPWFSPNRKRKFFFFFFINPRFKIPLVEIPYEFFLGVKPDFKIKPFKNSKPPKSGVFNRKYSLFPPEKKNQGLKNKIFPPRKKKPSRF